MCIILISIKIIATAKGLDLKRNSAFTAERFAVSAPEESHP
jgi:hypothetical protein